ncbi:MAG: TonB-dependent receptor [Capnocytophaga sp.]|nr:TonB-dependent receptor [Capnocytophaga sp.]
MHPNTKNKISLSRNGKLIPIFTIFYIMCIFITQAQPQKRGSLSGKVSYSNGEPVEMATVIIMGTSLHTYTDHKGFFRIENVPLGKVYEIGVSTLGSEPQKSKVDMTKKSAEISVRLSSDGNISLSEVTVTGKNSGTMTRDKGYAMGVIGTKEALFQNLQTTELLDRSAGIKIRQSAGLGSDISFNLNGLTGNSVRIFIDGIPIRNYGRSFSLSSIPPSMIDRIEVYKGVLPAELSEDALGGGINVVLKRDMQNSITTSYSYGSFNTHQWDLNANYRDRKSGFTANLSSFYNSTDNNYKVWGDNVYVVDNTTGRKTYITAKRFHDNYYSSGIKGGVGFTRKKWADELMLGFMFSETERDIQTGATMQVVYGNRKTEYNSGMASLQYKLNDIFTKGLDVSTFTTYSQTNRQVIDTIPLMYTWYGTVAKAYDGVSDMQFNRGGGEAGAATLAMNDEKNLANRTNLHYHFDKRKNHTIGVNYFLDAFTREVDDPMMTNEAREAMDKRNYNKQILGFTYEGHFIDKKLKTTLFYKRYNQKAELTEVNRRYNPGTNSYTVTTIKHDRNMDDNGYGITLSYAITPQIMLLASGERAVRLPGITELLGNTSQNIDPSFTLVPENSRNGNIGFNVGPFHYRKSELSAEVNFFVRDIHDMIQQGVPRNSEDFYQFENLGKVISKGVDFEFRYNHAKRLFFNTNFSYFDARFNLQYDANGIQYFYYKSRLRNAPYFTANANVEYIFRDIFQKKSRLAVNYNFGYTHEFFRDWENLGSANKATIPTQAVHDLAFTYTFPSQKLTLAANAKNVFDTQVFDNYALQKPGRAVYGKVTYTIF